VIPFGRYLYQLQGCYQSLNLSGSGKSTHIKNNDDESMFLL